MRESEATLRQLVQERDGAEREKWVILRHARDEAERCLNLTNQLTLRDTKISQMQEEMSQVIANGNCAELRVPNCVSNFRLFFLTVATTIEQTRSDQAVFSEQYFQP